MSVQQFCLRWNNHQPNFISVCSSLLHNGTLVDVTLAAEGRQLQAHKIVLSACSSYFQTLFTTNPCQHPIVILKDVQYDDLKTMVDFMYYGEVNVSQEQLPHILKTAEMLKIKGLAEMPTDAATLTKSESKSSSDQPDQLQSSGTDSLWGSSESQFQQQQPQSHHHSHHHHQQSQTQQMHQLRRTPSPLGTGTSPATRRKRLRKSSNNGSGDRITDDHSGVDAGGNINLSQMGQMSFGGNTSGLGHTLHTKIIKESPGVDVDSHQQDSSPDSLDDGNGHTHTMQIKPETDLSVPQSLPLDISGGTTPSENDGPNASCSQSSHSGTPPTSNTASSVPTLNVMGSKRNRFLIRQPRVKRDSDANNQISPETPALEFDPFSGTVTSSSPSLLLTVPPRIERHASEPAPSLVPSSPHLLSVPQGTPFLVKQHSHPLLPSQQSHMGVSSTSSHSSFALGLHRQHSHPLSSTLSGHISVSDAIYPHVTTSSGYIITGSPMPPSPLASTSSMAVGASSNSGHLITQQPIVSLSSLSSSSSSTTLKQEAENSSHSKSGQQHLTPTHASSSSVILISEPPSPVPAAASSSTAATTNLGSSSFEHMPTLRVKNEELQRSVSSPQTNREILTLENPRSSHCPVIRPGPALGCNFCWNTIDGHGRILRRKTKYHCPECQTNLCIVPCFQEYHERLSTENTASANDNNKNYSSSTGGSGGGGSNQRHYSKTESI